MEGSEPDELNVRLPSGDRVSSDRARSSSGSNSGSSSNTGSPLDFSLRYPRMVLTEDLIGTARFRCEPADFIVDEVLGFHPSGEGEHVYLHIRKTGQNTRWVIDELSRQWGIERSLFGHCGLKDRHAITTQWLSVQSPVETPSIDVLDIPGVEVIATSRHEKKLRPGSHEGNQFRLILRDITTDKQHIERALAAMAKTGFPNYFGSQRFGQNGQNLAKGWHLLSKRRLSGHKKKGIYLSALRSFVFNQVLAQRIDQRSVERAEDDCGPLWGRGRARISADQQSEEVELLRPWATLCDALEFSGLNQERRPLMCTPAHLSWEWPQQDQLQLSFTLPPGSYATALLTELAELEDGSSIADGSST